MTPDLSVVRIEIGTGIADQLRIRTYDGYAPLSRYSTPYRLIVIRP